MANNLFFLKLSNNCLRGRIPANFFNLSSVQWLYLDNNSFIGKIPDGLSNASWLEAVNIRNNYSSGVLPQWIGNMSSLLEISLAKNQLQGPIPVELCKLDKLQFLDLSENSLSGSLPACFNPPNITHNSLSSSIPRCLANMTFGSNHAKYFVKQAFSYPRPLALELDVSNNCINGQIPINLNVIFPSLESLNLSNNMFEGHIPPSFGDSRSLNVLDLSNNNLSGGIPEHLAMANNLFFLKLSNNCLRGRIPANFFNLSSVQWLYLDNNSFIGKIPDGLSNASWLEAVNIRNNYSSGVLPQWIGNMSSLLEISLAKNQLQGPIPVELCKLDKLQFLDLSENSLSGSLPACFNPPNITHNSLSSSIPRCLANMTFGSNHAKYFVKQQYHIPHYQTAPQSFKYSLDPNPITLWSVKEKVEFTTKSISYSYEGGILDLMSGIDFSCNQLIGEIPPQIGNINQLHMLNLSHNILTGSIPATFSNLRYIESLDLSYNHLNRSIPSKFTELNSLEVFSVAHNNLSGKIPDFKAQFATFDESSYKGNPYLCGPPSHNNCTDIQEPLSIQKDSKDEQNGGGFIDMDVFHVSYFVSYIMVLLGTLAVLYVNPDWERAWLHFIAVFSVAHNNLSGKIPDFKAQFATFDESSYKGNPYLCGPPSHNNCTDIQEPLSIQKDSKDEQNGGGFIDMDVFHVSYFVSYIMVLLGTLAVLYVNPDWERAWLHFIAVWMTSCYYFVIDSFRKLLNV
ncbi:unnamed protein product [Ilex paraguariensis]|uniref:Uncharacterized protein n=1 Tax=Ilex paraguariensis TaxID=185542 RepID=A0ABC8S7I5_9AQUA